MVQSHVYRMLDVLGNEGVLRLRHCTSLSAPVFSSTGDEAMGCALPSARCCIVSRKLPIAPALRSLDGPSSNGVLLTGAETRSRELPFAPALRSLDGPSSNGELLTGAETKSITWLSARLSVTRGAGAGAGGVRSGSFSASMPRACQATQKIFHAGRWSVEEDAHSALLTLRA